MYQGNQAVDTLIYNAADTSERYSAPDTVVRQRNIFITAGTQLMSNAGNVLMTVLNDTVFSFIMGYSSNIWQTNLQKKKD